jgi:DNA polymerase III alpha subunit
MLPQAAVQLDHELAILDRIGGTEDFLIAADIQRFAEAERIPFHLVGAGGNSIIPYLLGVSDIDPLRHSLFFERFRDPKGRWAPELLLRLGIEPERVIEGMRNHCDKEVIEKAVSLSNMSPKEQIPQRVAFSLQDQGQAFRLDTIPDNDRKAFALFETGDTQGILFFDNEWTQKELVSRIQPRSMADLMAIRALQMIGMFDENVMNEYVDHGMAHTYPAAVKSDILELAGDSRGLILYEEQVMALLSWFGGMPLAEGYDLVRTICKEKREIIESDRTCFSWNAYYNGLDRPTAEAVFDVIEAAASYTVCKSHYAAEALVAYQSAYLKANFPDQFNRVLQNVLADGGEERDRLPCLHETGPALPPRIQTPPGWKRQPDFPD